MYLAILNELMNDTDASVFLKPFDPAKEGKMTYYLAIGKPPMCLEDIMVNITLYNIIFLSSPSNER